MTISTTLQLALDDLIADLRHARRVGDLGRLALVAYCEVRPWARKAGQAEVGELLSEMMIGSPHTSRNAFLDQIDRLIFELLSIYQQSQDTLQDPGTASDNHGSGAGSQGAFQG